MSGLNHENLNHEGLNHEGLNHKSLNHEGLKHEPKHEFKHEKILEAILFAAGEAVAVGRLAEILGIDIPAVRGLLSRMAEHYISEESGIQLMEIEDSFQLCTNPKYHSYAKGILAEPPKRALTQPLLETLSIIAYKQPVTKSVIEEIRGVTADHAVNKLLEYGLVTEKGRLEGPGKPILFGTTTEFLRYFGLQTVEEFLTKAQKGPEQLKLDSVG